MFGKIFFPNKLKESNSEKILWLFFYLYIDNVKYFKFKQKELFSVIEINIFTAFYK